MSKGLYCTGSHKSVAPGRVFEQQGPLRRPYNTHGGGGGGALYTLPGSEAHFAPSHSRETKNLESPRPINKPKLEVSSRARHQRAAVHTDTMGPPHLREEKTEVGRRVSNAPRLTVLDRFRLRTSASQPQANAPPLVPKVSGKGLLEHGPPRNGISPLYSFYCCPCTSWVLQERRRG